MKANNTTQPGEESVMTENSDITDLQKIAHEYRRDKEIVDTEVAKAVAEKEKIKQDAIEQHRITMKNNNVKSDPDKHLTHRRGVEHAACCLIENGISTKDCDIKGVDLLLDNGRTISVRGSSTEIRQPLMNGTLDDLKADYVMIVTNLGYRCTRKSYIMTLTDAKLIARNQPFRNTGRNSWFMDVADYRQYRDNYEVIV